MPIRPNSDIRPCFAIHMPSMLTIKSKWNMIRSRCQNKSYNWQKITRRRIGLCRSNDIYPTSNSFCDIESRSRATSWESHTQGEKYFQVESHQPSTSVHVGDIYSGDSSFTDWNSPTRPLNCGKPKCLRLNNLADWTDTWQWAAAKLFTIRQSKANSHYRNTNNCFKSSTKK